MKEGLRRSSHTTQNLKTIISTQGWIRIGKMAGVELLPKEYGYVALVLVLYCSLNFWMAGQVVKARKKYKVSYPTLYASESDNKDAKVFNCVQRGHQNSLELMPMFFVLLILGGIKHPLISASLGLFYIFTRYFYFTGYATGNPENRVSIGKFGFLAILGLMICTISFGISLLLA
uniref:Glutathione S-transferase 3, mitochondrial n=1 Tax=Davidia involucrata TaxID=16924 RepID=A0A5B7BY16_DAVIN